jgi:hypothetical protein
MPDTILLSPEALGLSRGDRSAAVRDLHAYLSRFGWLALPGQTPVIAAHESLPEAEPDSFDEATEAGLTDFQRFYRLPVTGRLDVETLALMRRPRCGVPDRPIARGGPGQFVAEATKWTNLRPTWHLATGTADLSDATVNDALFRAYRSWALIAQIAPRGGPAPGDINVLFGSGNHGDSWPFDGAGSVLAHGFPPPPNNGTLAGDLHFDDAETWTTNLPPTGTDLPTVALHEAGHTLGLDHSAVASAVMFAFYGGPRRTLTDDDIAGLRSIYGTRNRTIWTDIDTAVDGEGPFAGKAYLFRGSQYLRYDWADDLPDAGYPARIVDGWHGLPAGFTDNLDAALNGQGPFAGKAYFFKGDQYVRYDWATDRTDPGYPKSFPGLWPGLPAGFTSNVQAALNGQRQFAGKLYFFKGASYARYDWAADRGDGGYPQPIEFTWL